MTKYAQVVFPSSKKAYTYKTSLELEIGERVLVDMGGGAYTVVKILRLSDINPSTVPDDKLKPILGSVEHLII